MSQISLRPSDQYVTAVTMFQYSLCLLPSVCPNNHYVSMVTTPKFVIMSLQSLYPSSHHIHIHTMSQVTTPIQALCPHSHYIPSVIMVQQSQTVSAYYVPKVLYVPAVHYHQIICPSSHFSTIITTSQQSPMSHSQSVFSPYSTSTQDQMLPWQPSASHSKCFKLPVTPSKQVIFSSPSPVHCLQSLDRTSLSQGSLCPDTVNTTKTRTIAVLF